MHGLLLAALDHSSEIRMQRYAQAVEKASTLEELVTVARQIYQEDLRGGHITVFSEMVGASLVHQELAPALIARSQRYVDFVANAIRKAAGDSPLLQLFPPEDVAYGVICFYVGVNLMTQLSHDHTRAARLFDVADRVAPLVSPMLDRS